MILESLFPSYTLKFDSFNVSLGFFMILKNFEIPMEQAAASKSKATNFFEIFSFKKYKAISQSDIKALKQ